MAIEKLTEFAKTGQKNTDDLNLEIGFVVNRKPARQWFNWLFNTLTTKINEIIDGKLDSDATAVAAQKLQTSRQISFSGAATGSFNFDGSKGESCVLTLANSGAEAGTYGTTLKIPVITVNAKGLITTATTQDIPSASTSAKGLVQLNNTLTSTSVTQALTAAQGKILNDKFTTDFDSLKVESGYQKLPSGLIFQWGAATLAASTGGTVTRDVTYPISFPNAVLHVFPTYATSTGANADSVYTTDRTQTGFKIGQTAAETSHISSWLAIGY